MKAKTWFRYKLASRVLWNILSIKNIAARMPEDSLITFVDLKSQKDNEKHSKKFLNAEILNLQKT